MNEHPPQVDFYWRPGCGFCSSLHRQLSRDGVELTMHNIWEDPDAAAIVRQATGGSETVPTVGIAGRYMVNPRARQVMDVLETAGDAG
jgi:mycoredoxin